MSSSSADHALLPTSSPSRRRRPRLLCVGVAGIDYVASLPSFPWPDDKVRSQSLVIDGGGNVANTACAIAKLSPNGPTVDIATAVGDDANGKLILDGLRDAGVGIPNETVQRYSGSSAFTYVISAPGSNGEHTRTCIHHPPSSGLTPEFAQAIPLKGRYDCAHFDARYPDAAIVLARRCVEAGIPYSIDVEKPREGLDELMANASVIVCNSSYCGKVLGKQAGDEEAGGSEMSDGEVVNKLRLVMREKAPNAMIAVTTLGSRGACLISLDPPEHGQQSGGDDVEGKRKCATWKHEEDAAGGALAHPVDSGVAQPEVTFRHGALWCQSWPECRVVDTTGAGDAFQGGFLAALWSAADAVRGDCSDGDRQRLEVPCWDDVVLTRALLIGTRVAAKKVEMMGARRGLPSAKEDHFLQREFHGLLCDASGGVE